MAKVLNVDPASLQDAAKGINGVISDLSHGAGVAGGYTGGTGRGFSAVELSGGQVGHAGAKAALDNFANRWEWGTRALVQAANHIGEGLDLAGVGFAQTDRAYVDNAAKGWVNDLAGDPSLQQSQIEQMSWSQLADYNHNRLVHPDYSAQSFAQVAPDIEQNLHKTAANSVDVAINTADPTHLTSLVPIVTEQAGGQRFDIGEHVVDGLTGDQPPQVSPQGQH